MSRYPVVMKGLQSCSPKKLAETNVNNFLDEAGGGLQFFLSNAIDTQGWLFFGLYPIWPYTGVMTQNIKISKFFNLVKSPFLKFCDKSAKSKCIFYIVRPKNAYWKGIFLDNQSIKSLPITHLPSFLIFTQIPLFGSYFPVWRGSPNVYATNQGSVNKLGTQ